jgi:RNA polymerase sigma-70 factor (ECF subfamily)
MSSATWIGERSGVREALARWTRRWLHAFSTDPGASERRADSLPSVRGHDDSGNPGKIPAVDALYRKYASSLYWVCLKYVKNKEDAEDMVNQVFIKVQQNLPGFNGQCHIYSWMYRIAVNECIQLFRKRKFEADGGSLPDFEDMLRASPEESLDARILLERMTKDADPETVEIVFLLYLEGLTQQEVVEKLGISRTTVHRKVVAFKAKMERFK